jgi:hypothetical protein
MTGTNTPLPPPPIKVGSTPVQCPMLSQTNHNSWPVRMRWVFRVHGILQAIESTGTGASAVDEKKNDLAVALLFQSIPEELVLQVSHLETTKEIWTALKTRFVGVERVRESRIETLEAEFESSKMKDNDTIDSFSGKIANLVSKAANLGTVYEDKKLIRKLLGSVPPKYIHLVASIEQFADLKTMSFQEAIGHLKTFEERIKRVEATVDNQGKLLYQSISHDKPNHGKGKMKEGSNKGRKQEHQNRSTNKPNSEKGETSNNKKDRSKVQCFRCDRFGHFASVCPERKKKIQEANLNKTTEDEEELFMAVGVPDIVFLNEEKVIPKRFESKTKDDLTWYLDNGASNHMTGNQEFFSALNINNRKSLFWG